MTLDGALAVASPPVRPYGSSDCWPGSRRRPSTGFVESTVNAVVSTRFAKRQQMRWTPQGAHLLLQVRTKVLNGELDGLFRGRYPGFRPAPAEPAAAVA